MLPSTTGAGWYGSYPDASKDPGYATSTVASACHCMELCVKHVTESVIALAVAIQLVQVAFQGAPGCTILGCATLFQGVLDTNIM